MNAGAHASAPQARQWWHLRAYALAPVPLGTRALLAALVAITAAWACAWLLDRTVFFHADDWDWLARAHFYQGTDQAGLLPQKPYNDRPVGALLIRLGYRAFGLDAQAFHAAAIVLHVLNSLLALALALRLLPPWRALVAGLLSAAWFAANGAVAWTAAVFDLAGATFCLAAVLLYGAEGRNPWRWRLGALACHVLAIRTKEFGLGLVFALLAWEAFAARAPDWRRLMPHVGVTVVFAVAYAVLFAQSPVRGPYTLSLSPLEWMQSLWAYVRLLGNGDPWSALALVAICAAHIALRNRAGLFGAAAALSVLAAVLPVTQQRYGFYLYAPHFFAAISIAALGFGRVTGAAAALLALVLVATPQWDGTRAAMQRDVRAQGRYAGALHRDLLAWASTRRGADGVVVHVVDRASSPFLQGHSRLTRFNPWLLGPGNAIKMALENPHADVRVPADRTEAIAACRRLRLPLLLEEAGRLRDATVRMGCLTDVAPGEPGPR